MLTLESPQADDPPGLALPLQRHQCTSLYAAMQMEQDRWPPGPKRVTSKIGILGDPVGAGKTVLALCLCLSPPPVPRPSHTHSNEFVSIYRHTTRAASACSLVVLPHGLVGMWISHIEKFLPSLRYQVFRYQRDFQNFELRGDTQVVLVSSTRCRDFIEERAAQVRWARVIYEEADSIRIPANPEIDADFIWLVTATPSRLFPYHTSTGFLRRLVGGLYGLVHNGLMDSVTVHNHIDVIKTSIALPEPEQQVIRCHLPPMMRHVTRMVSRQVLQALHADDLDTAIQMLSCRSQTHDNIVQAVREDLEHQIVRAEARLDYQTRVSAPAERVGATAALLRSLRERLASVLERLESQDNCPICLEDLTTSTRAMLTCCHHWYCVACLTESLAAASSASCVADRRRCLPWSWNARRLSPGSARPMSGSAPRAMPSCSCSKTAAARSCSRTTSTTS